MATLQEIIERNRRHGGSPYLIFFEAALPTGRTLRIARDPQSWVWPLDGATVQQFTAPEQTAVFTLAAAGTLTFSVGGGEWTGTVLLERDEGGGAWFEVAQFTRRSEGQMDAQPAGTYRLRSGAGFAGETRGILAGGSAKLWQAGNFEQEDWREGEGAQSASLTISVSNVSGLPRRYVDELEDWRKRHGRASCSIRILCVNTALLHRPDPVQELRLIDVGMSCPAPMQQVRFMLGVPKTFDRQVPRRRFMRDYCTWQRAEDCPHVAVCDHTLTRCKEISDTIDAGRIDFFGGFPFIGKGALYE